MHYRVGGKLTHCGVEMLPNGKDIENIIIERFEFHEQMKINGQVQENVWEAHFVKNSYTTLPMMLNSTNRRRLVKQAGTDYLQTVKFFPVRLTKEKTRDPQGGGQIYGLRISLTPAKRYSLEEGSDQFNKVKAGVNDERNWSICQAYYDDKTLELLKKK